MGLTPWCERGSKGGGKENLPNADGVLPQAWPAPIPRDPQVGGVTPSTW